VTTQRANLLLGLVVTVACLALLEICAGVIFERSDRGNGKRLVETAVQDHERFVGVKDSFIIPHPYLLYTVRPGFEDLGFKQVNALGYRGHEITREKPPGTYRILCLGGSTTMSYPYVKDPGQAWPALVEAGLNRRFPGRHFEVLNAGLPYGTSAEMLAGYMFRHRYLQPDMVIIHEGGNDTDPLLFEDYNPEYTHFRSAGVRVVVGPIERVLLHSSIFRIFYMRYWRGVPTIYVSQPYGFDQLSREKALQRVQDTYPLGFERNLELIIRTAQNDGAKVMLVGFVSEREELLSKNWPSMKGLEHATRLGIDKNLAVMETLAARYQVPYLSPADVTFKDEWFLDGCHLNEEGEGVKANWILGSVVHLLDPTAENAPAGSGRASSN
jgi:lysophospholipase L1-like esterase